MWGPVLRYIPDNPDRAGIPPPRPQDRRQLPVRDSRGSTGHHYVDWEEWIVTV